MSTRQYLVIGAGRFGSALAVTLSDAGHEVVVVDNDEAAVDAIAGDVDHALIADATNERAVGRLGVDAFDTVVVAIGSDLDASILATVAVKSAGARHLVSKADNEMIARVLASIGADEVVRPEYEMGRRVANQLTTPSVFAQLELGPDHRIAEVEPTALSGTLTQLRLPDRYGLQVLAVRRGARLHVNPAAAFTVHPGDELVVLGSNEDFQRFHSQECA